MTDVHLAPIVLESYRDEWAVRFDEEAGALRSALGDVLLMIHHIGSTAIPGIVAKPVIDMLAVVPDVTLVDRRVDAVVALGYESKGEFGIRGRRYFRKESVEGVRTHQLHVFAKGSAEIDRHLWFRDFLRAHPDDAQAYALLKQELAARCAGDTSAYTNAKSDFILEIDRRATHWRSSHDQRS